MPIGAAASPALSANTLSCASDEMSLKPLPSPPGANWMAACTRPLPMKK